MEDWKIGKLEVWKDGRCELQGTRLEVPGIGYKNDRNDARRQDTVLFIIYII